MKHLLRYGIMIVLIFISGCSSQAIVYSNDYVPGQDHQYWYYPSPSPECPMVDAFNGYYFMNGPENHYLFFLDKATGEAAPVCNKPECVHNDNTCNSYLTKFYVRTLIYYLDKVYYVSLDFVDDTGNWRDVLYELSPDGTHKKLLTFSESIDFLTFHRGYVYYMTTDNGTISGKENETQTTVRLYRLPVQKINNEPETLYEFQGIYAFAGNILCYGNDIYFLQMSFEGEPMELKTEMKRYSILDKSIESILEGRGQYTIFNGKLAFMDLDGTYICDLDGQNIQKIYDKGGILLPDNDYLLVDTISDADVRKGEKPRTITALDREGNYAGSVDLDGFTNNPIGIVDNQFLFSLFDMDKQTTAIYQIPVEKIADGTGQPEVFFEYTGQ